MRKAVNVSIPILILMLSVSSVFGWVYFSTWTGSVDDGRDIAQCADGGFYLVGRSNTWADGGFSFNPYDYEAFLIKLDADGDREWYNHYGQVGYFLSGSDVYGYYDAGWSVCATPDSGCIIAGKTQSPNYTEPFSGMPDDCIGYDNMLLVRVDKYGDTLWTRSYGGYYFDRAWHIFSIPGTSDFFVTGCTHTYGVGTPAEDQENMWVMRIDSAGSLLYQNGWGNLLPGTSDARWSCITPDGGIILVGATANRETTYTDSDSTITRRICKTAIVKFDSQCNYVWEKIYDRGYFHYARSITAAYDGGYIVLTYDNEPRGTWLLRIDEEGDTLWTKHIGLDSTGAVIANYRMIVQGPDSGYYIAGFGQSSSRIMFTDIECNKVWEVETDFGSESEYFNSCIMTEDSGCCAVGVTYSYPPSAYEDVYAVRVDRYGNDYSGITESKTKKPDMQSIFAYPNPFNSSCVINVPADAKIEIYDLRGNVVYDCCRKGLKTSNDNSSENRHREMSPTYRTFIWVPDKSVASGIYLIRATAQDGQRITKRIVYLK